MARVKVEVPKDQLWSAIVSVEKSGALMNRSKLYAAVAETDWARNFKPKPLTASVIMLRVEEYELEPKTPKGKRGRAAGFGGGRPPGKRVSRAEKFAADPVISAALDDLEASTDERFQHLVKKARNGSMRAAVALRCIDCSGGSTAEVRKCPVTDCGLYAFRPYKDSATNSDDMDSSDSESEEVCEAA